MGYFDEMNRTLRILDTARSHQSLIDLAARGIPNFPPSATGELHKNLSAARGLFNVPPAALGEFDNRLTVARAYLSPLLTSQLREIAAAQRFGDEVYAAQAGLTALETASSFQMQLARDLAKQFNFGLPTATQILFETLSGKLNAAALGVSALSIRHPGLHAMAELGVEGLVARGLAADAMLAYEDDLSDTPFFAEARDSFRDLDDKTEALPHASTRLEQVRSEIVPFVRKAREPVSRRALIMYASFALTGVGTVLTGAAYWDGRDSAKSADIENLREEFEATRKEVAALAAYQQERDRRYRVVADRAPLRAGPSKTAEIIRDVYDDQMLKVVDERGTWLQVDVYDYRGQRIITGWVNRARVRLG